MDGGSIGGGGVEPFVFLQAFPGTLQLAPKGRQLVIRTGALGKGRGTENFGIQSCGLGRGQVGKACHGFLPAVVGVHGFVLGKGILQGFDPF